MHNTRCAPVRHLSEFVDSRRQASSEGLRGNAKVIFEPAARDCHGLGCSIGYQPPEQHHDR
jgi:hypothetical protein